MNGPNPESEFNATDASLLSNPNCRALSPLRASCVRHRLIWLVVGLISAQIGQGCAAEFRVVDFDRIGHLSWTNSEVPGVCTIEFAPNPVGPWIPLQSFFTTNSGSQVRVFPGSDTSYFRLLTVDISPTPSGFKNLIESYGILRTIAGNGTGGLDGVNYWQASFEDGPATNAALSRPHFAMGDSFGNIFIVDKDSHSVLKVTPDGRIHTVAGTHSRGNGPDGPMPATEVQLDSPNGLWVRSDGTAYVLDTGNGKVRRLGIDGMMTTLLTDGNGIVGGRGLWVKDGEGLVYYADNPNVKKWTPGGGVSTVNNKSFVDLGNLIVDSTNNVIVTDRSANRVYVLHSDGTRDPLAGDGTTNRVVEGALALNTGLYGVRGVWPLPNGGYLFATHEGSQVLYADSGGVIHVFVEGAPGNVHGGDGAYFRSPGFKISEVRSVGLDSAGNVLITENDSGYVRMITFLRLAP